MCEFFHIPFQSGDDDVLRGMRRGYTHARYRNIVDNIRRHMPDASISGDAIVGFPGDAHGPDVANLQSLLACSLPLLVTSRDIKCLASEVLQGEALCCHIVGPACYSHFSVASHPGGSQLRAALLPISDVIFQIRKLAIGM